MNSNDNPSPTCNNCLHWLSHVQSERGSCRRYPPTSTGFPTTHATVSCGEHTLLPIELPIGAFVETDELKLGEVLLTQEQSTVKVQPVKTVESVLEQDMAKRVDLPQHRGKKRR